MDQIKKIDDSVNLGTRIRKKFKSFLIFHLALIVAAILAIYPIPIIKSLITYGQELQDNVFIIGLSFLVLILYISFRLVWSMAITLLEED